MPANRNSSGAGGRKYSLAPVNDRVKPIDQPGIDWSVGEREPYGIQDLGGDEIPVAIGEIVEGEAAHVESATEHRGCAAADSVGECSGGNISQEPDEEKHGSYGVDLQLVETS